MPEIRMRLREADGHLPAVCMCCGAPASTTKVKKMRWCPPWVGVLILAGLLPYVIVAVILTKRATVQAPLCEPHQGHWLNRLLLIWGSFFLFGLVGLAGIIFAVNLPLPDRENAFPFVCIGTIILLVIWLVIVIVCQNTVIRPREITDAEITLTGVCDAFVNAVEDAREERWARKRDRPRRWDEQDEDEPRPRQTPPSEAIEE
jgi:hypothetical protein